MKIFERNKRERDYRPLPILIAIFGLCVGAAASALSIRATVDGVLVNFRDVQPAMVGGRVLVPVRGVFEHMNAHVNWDANTRTVVVHRGNDEVRLPLNSLRATLNGNEVKMDAPVVIRSGRTMVPLRFLSETLGAGVEWIAEAQMVEITTASGREEVPSPGYTVTRMDAGTVIPFRLNGLLSSNGSSVGDRFTAKVDTGDLSNYQGLSRDAILEGHIDVAKARSGRTPGVLGLVFDRLRMPDGQTFGIQGSLIGLDENSVDNENGRLTAKPGRNSDNLKYVGIGAGGGALVAILTKGNLLTNSVIGAAVGFLYGEIQKDSSKARDVRLEEGAQFGVRLTEDLSYRAVSRNLSR